MTHDGCWGCKSLQTTKVKFDAVYPFSTVTHEIEYCKHLNVLLDDKIKDIAFKLDCKFKRDV